MSLLDAVLTAVLVLATSIWVGGLVAIMVVARIAARTLDPAARVALFRGLGRVYLVVGTAALVVGYAAGGVLVRHESGGPLLVATGLVAVALVAVLAVGVEQARQMTRLRRRSVEAAGDPALAARLAEQVRRGAVRAAVLRAGLGGLSLALLVLGVAIAA
ncbi:hypothetical protein [Nocardioides sp.]|uniref:hypothetical protein n=1 Tax=Nocardioides sp. TaxID=35761 RepID=UPI00262B76E7|nr:hypothetical protein [Nocardioides sp.]MDI6912258.1 hypothetical protein [Nocardioides sp.]